MFKDCHGEPLPVYAQGIVSECLPVVGAIPFGSVYSLKVLVSTGAKFTAKGAVCGGEPDAGQFYMLHALRSNVLLGRPISVYHSCQLSAEDSRNLYGTEKYAGAIELTFLILLKGKGTRELCSLDFGDLVNLIGPCGNRFPEPDSPRDTATPGTPVTESSATPGAQATPGTPHTASSTAPGDASATSATRAPGSVCDTALAAQRTPAPENTPASASTPHTASTAPAGKVCIVGGGIGVAPVAGFAETLPDKSYDFFASFKSGSYGLKNLKADKLVITTDDGSVGVHGMLPVALTADTLRQGAYTALYACGPTPMLAYIQKICREAGVRSYLSMEAHMACGVGVCLGCVIDTTEGKKRCCKDGPVFDGDILLFNPVTEVAGIKVQPRRDPLAQGQEPDLSVNIAGVRFENPIIGSSGTFGFGTEYESLFDVNRLGGISSKGLTLEPRQGNDGIRLHETPAGLMNSIGLQNPGIPHFIEHELPRMLALKPVAIANLSGSSLETYVEGAKLLDATKVPMIELNISCPNVSAGGAAFGMTCVGAAQAVQAVRAVTKKPLLVKLTPQSHELEKVALACIEAGANGISLCNSFQGIAIDIERGVPVFDKLKAGFGGPAVRPIAVRLVYEVVQAINSLPVDRRVPVIAIGGAATWEDAVEFIMAGASAVQVGTNTFANPNTMIEMIDGLAAFMKRKGYHNIEEMRGLIQKA